MAQWILFAVVLKAFKADLDTMCLLLFPQEMFLFDT